MTKIMPILDASDPNFAEQLTKAIGAEPGDTIVIHTPQFTRTDGRVVNPHPGSIPAGLPIVDINGEHELFEPGKTDDDMRYGALAFGFLRKAD